MALENVLEKLEGRIEDLLGLYSKSQNRAEVLETRVTELERELERVRTEKDSATEEKRRLLEEERRGVADRLEKTIALIDGVLSEFDGEERE